MLGADVWQNPAEAKARMGVLPDGIRMLDRLTGAELLRSTPGCCAEVAEDGGSSSRTGDLLDALGASPMRGDTLVVDYSAGMRKKIGLACALIHAPRLLILDEPLEAVDPVSGETIRQILRSFVDGGGTVVLSSHVMELVESMCDRVAIVAEGRLLAHGPARRGARRPLRCSSDSSRSWGRTTSGRRRSHGCAPRKPALAAAASSAVPQHPG